MSNPLGYNQSLVFRDDPAPGNWLQKLTGRPFQLPSFFIAGAQKSGTTSLATALAKHPGISPPQLKEPFYYGNDVRYAKGRGFYERNFPNQGKITFDASTNYLDHPAAAERILKDQATAKVILILRNPADRAFSHYKMQVRNKIEELSFEEALQKETERIAEGDARSPGHNYCYQRLGYRSRGEYSRMIKPWLNKFPAHQLLVLIAEDFFAEPKRVYSEVLSFLQLEPHIPQEIEIMNAGTPSSVNKETIDQLKEYYRPFNTELSALLKTDLRRWD